MGTVCLPRSNCNPKDLMDNLYRLFCISLPKRKNPAPKGVVDDWKIPAARNLPMPPILATDGCTRAGRE